MSQNPTTDRRRAPRRQITDRRSGVDRRVVEDRRVAERRIATVAVEKDRRTGIDRRARALTTMATQHQIVVYALRRIISRLYRLAQARARPGKAGTHLAEARTEVLKLDPNLYAVRGALDALSNTAIAKEPEYEQARGMLGQFESPAVRAETTKAARKTATRKKSAAKKKTTSHKRAARRKPSTTKRT